MQIHTTARHCELDGDVRQFAQERLEKFGKVARVITEAHLVVTAEGYRHAAEITLKLKRKEFVSREESTEQRAAIDLAADRLEHQLRKLKEYRIARRRGRTHENVAPPAATNGAAEPEGDFEFFLDDEED
jgi:putative sigma-54 modulation protein